MRLIIAVLIAIVLVVPGLAMRPLSTDDAWTLGQGAWEIEEGYELDQPKGGGSSSGSLGTSIKYGIFSNIDFGIEVPYSMTSPTGVGDATLKGKIGINEALALGIDVKLTNGDTASGLGSGYADYGVNGIFSTGLGNAEAHINIGYTVIGQAGGAASDNNVLSYGAAVVYPYNNVMNLMAEIVGSSTPSAATNPMDALVGLNWAVNDLLTLDGGISAGLTDGSPEYKATIGATLAL